MAEPDAPVDPELVMLRKYRDDTDDSFRLWASEPVWEAMVQKLEAEKKYFLEVRIPELEARIRELERQQDTRSA